MALADELLNLRRELATAGSPLQRMKMLARSWRTLRQLTPAERKQLATAVGADGAEDILGKLAAHKGRVGPAFLVPALEKLKNLDADALARLVEVVRDPDQRREAMRKSVRAAGDVLIEEPDKASEEEPTVDVELDNALEVDIEPVAQPEAEEARQDEPAHEDQLPDVPTVAPRSEPPIVLPRHEVVPPPPPPRSETAPRRPVSIAPQESGAAPELERVRAAPTLVRRLALAREALQDADDWTVDQLRALIEIFPHDWARRRIVVEMLRHRTSGDLAQTIDLVESLESRASRRWCISHLLHEWELSESERQVLRGHI